MKIYEVDIHLADKKPRIDMKILGVLDVVYQDKEIYVAKHGREYRIIPKEIVYHVCSIYNSTYSGIPIYTDGITGIVGENFIKSVENKLERLKKVYQKWGVVDKKWMKQIITWLGEE